MTDNSPVELSHPGPVDPTLPPAGQPTIAPTVRSPSPRKPPLISAIEIENFKGIGAPARIELRPITLLFGQNSAGKSTVLHALCYAHELLSHRNVDAHRTERGGDQIDLGGFRQLVHGHDPERTIRLRFDLNLTEWSLPETLTNTLLAAYAEYTAAELLQELADLPAKVVRGWVELRARLRGEQPVLTRYEVGVNDIVVGRIEAREGSDLALDFSAAHPLLTGNPFGAASEAEGHTVDATPVENPDRVRDASDARSDRWRRRSLMALDELTGVVPHWSQIFPLDYFQLERLVGREDLFAGRFSALMVGVGQALRDEVATLRYIGPLRELRPRWGAQLSTSRTARWADGSAAWEHLQNTADPQLVDDVSDWLSGKERLDAGYALRARSIVAVDEGAASLVPAMREYQQLRTDFPDAAGSVDLNPWARRMAEAIVERIRQMALHLDESLEELTVDAVEAHLKSKGDDEWSALVSRSDAFGDAVRNYLAREGQVARRNYRRLHQLVSRMARRDFTSREIDDLIVAVAAHPPRRELELVTTKTGLPVRISDVGVGVSQVLPIVVAALDPERPAVTAIEQPELHLHPRVQVELGELFAHCAAAGGVLLIETHSEHLLLRIMRRMRQTNDDALPDGDSPVLRPDDVNVLLVEIDPHHERTLIREMPLNERGELVKAWPGGFFEESLREIF